MSDEVIHNQQLERYELVIDGELAGFTQYELRGTEIVFMHTEITRHEREHGLGGRLVEGALSQVRHHTDYRVVAECPFVARWIGEHPNYRKLLTR